MCEEKRKELIFSGVIPAFSAEARPYSGWRRASGSGKRIPGRSSLPYWSCLTASCAYVFPIW